MIDEVGIAPTPCKCDLSLLPFCEESIEQLFIRELSGQFESLLELCHLLLH